MNNNIFMSRKKKHGSLPRNAPNNHRTYNPNAGTSRSRPLAYEVRELTKLGRKKEERKWLSIFVGREKINHLFYRAGVVLGL